MIDWLHGIDVFSRETVLFASIGLLIGGLDDLLVDMLFLVHRLRRGRTPAMTLASLPHGRTDERLAVFVAAWDEAAVIGAMLASAVARFDHPDYHIYVGLYPNDPATIDAAAAVAEHDARIRLVVGLHDGPTTKADCLNTLWHALRRADALDRRETAAVILHDAEDVVHAGELQVFASLIGHHAVVQLPVVPLVAAESPIISGHYADEFAEAHAKTIVVRTALGAGMPLAGTGCAIATPMLARIAAQRNDNPFDAASLTEDYELGLRIAELGGRSLFARVRDSAGGLVAVRAYFPDSIDAAVRQKARWMTGIALAGWDRTGWARASAIGDHWMRMRDRRAPLAVLVLAVAYIALLSWGADTALRWWLGRTPSSTAPEWIVGVNMALLAWRMCARMICTASTYGWREARWSAPRFVVGNIIALLAARRAMFRYVAMLRGAPAVWDKTVHAFPESTDIDLA